MLARRPIPAWLAVNWWWLLAGNIIELELCAHLHHGSVNSGASLGTWFLTIWGLLQAGWLRSVDRRSHAMFWYGAAAILNVLTMVTDSGALHARSVEHFVSVLLVVLSIAAAIIGVFVFRSDMKRYFRATEDAGFELSWWMALLFSDFYFQYHFHRMAEYQASNLRLMPGEDKAYPRG